MISVINTKLKTVSDKDLNNKQHNIIDRQLKRFIILTKLTALIFVFTMS